MRIEDMNDVQLQLLTLEWDIEYWKSYIRSYEDGSIESSKNEVEELEKCKSELLKTELELNSLRCKHAEELI